MASVGLCFDVCLRMLLITACTAFVVLELGLNAYCVGEIRCVCVCVCACLWVCVYVTTC